MRPAESQRADEQPAQSPEERAFVSTSPSPETSKTPTPTPRFAFPVTCGPIDPVRCEEFVEGLVEGIAKSRPGTRIARVVIETEKGSYQMDFTDGTGVGADVD
jgi:hypothetical protein